MPERRRPGRPRHVTPSPEYVNRRAEIVAVAAEVFQVKGFDAGSLDDVATALDLRKASLYYYVHSKAELLYLIFDRAISAALLDLEAANGSEAADERLASLIRHQIQTVATNRSMFAVFFDQRPRLDPAYETDIRAKERRYLGLFVTAVEGAIADGAMSGSDPRHIAQLVLGMANWTYKWVDPRRDDISAIADAAVELVLGPTS